MMLFAMGLMISFMTMLVGVPIGLALMRAFGLYLVVNEGECHVYVLFGKVLGHLREPGLCCPFAIMGWRTLLVGIMGKCYVLDMRMDQKYQRSLPVNSEEGAPIGIGVWYEMYISDPVAYLFKNADPQGSLAANVSNAVVRCLSNMPLAELLGTRHGMSLMVRNEVSPKSNEWGYKLGSVYVRKVHFRDTVLVRQIEEKVVNRLRQVTSAIKQDGSNQVNIITNTADRQAAIEFARAKAVRLQIVGETLQRISTDPEVNSALFEVLEVQRILEGDSTITLFPSEIATPTQCQ